MAARFLPSGSQRPRGIALTLCGLVALALALRVAAAVVGLDVRSGSDSDVYERLAARLYESRAWGIPGSENPYDFAPGPPLFASAVYYLTGGANPLFARLAMAVAGSLAVVVVFLIGRRLAGPSAGVMGAGIFAVYPVPIYYTGKLTAEPIAVLTLASAVLAFLWARDEGRSWWAWAVPGVCFGFTALLRPEYLAFGALFALLAGAFTWRRGGAVPGLAGGGVFAVAFALVIAPWTVHVTRELGRYTPISTGGGKALFIGSYLPGGGLHDGVKRHLLQRFRGKSDVPLEELRQTSMTPLLDRVASRYPHLSRDAALRRVGQANVRRYATQRPAEFAEMVMTKMAYMWQGSGAPSRTLSGAIAHFTVLGFGLAGLVLLALRRRWEAVPLAALILGVTVIGGLLLAGTRRNVPLMPLVAALAGVSAIAGAQRARAAIGRAHKTLAASQDS